MASQAPATTTTNPQAAASTAAQTPAVQKTGICLLPLDNSLPKVAIVCGDPGRAKKIADAIHKKGGSKSEIKIIAQMREYHTFVVEYKGFHIIAGSHGIGVGGASCYFDELFQAGVSMIIRAGTCGSFVPWLTEGNLIVATSAVRTDGVTDRLVPIEFPAVSDYQVVKILADKCEELHPQIPKGVGPIQTIGHFYDGPLGNKNRFWASAGVLGIEMEVSGLFTIAALRGRKAGALLNVDNYIFQREIDEARGEPYKPLKEETLKGTDRMIDIVIESAVSIYQRDAEQGGKFLAATPITVPPSEHAKQPSATVEGAPK